MKLFISKLLLITLVLLLLSSIPLSLSTGDLYINVGDTSNQLKDLSKFFTSKYVVNAYTLLGKNASIVDLESTVWIDLGESYDVDINGSFSFELNSSVVTGEGFLKGYITYTNNTMNLPNIGGTIEVNGVTSGGKEEVVTKAIVNGTTSVYINDVEQKIDYYLPIKTIAKVVEEGIFIITNTSIVNGYIVLSGSKLDIVYNNVRGIFLNESKVETETSLKVYSSDMITLYMIKQMLSTYFNITVEGPQYDPKIDKYYISYYDKSIYSIEEGITRVYLREYLGVDLEKIDGKFSLKANYHGGGNTITVDFSINGYFTVIGDFSKGFIIDERKSIVLKSINVRGKVSVKENNITIKIDLRGEYTSLNLYLVQYSYRELVPTIIGNSEEGGKAVLESSREDVWFLLDNKTYTKLVFVPENASLANNLYIVVNGTILESDNPWEESISYRVVSNIDVAKVYVFNESTKEIRVYASRTREVIVYGKDTGLSGKCVEIDYGKYSRVAIRFSENFDKIPKVARVRVLDKLPKPLPKSVINVSKAYDISVETNVKTRIRIWYDSSSVPENTRLYIAHYSGDSWELLKPDSINIEEGYVEVIVDKFSPFTVVAVPSGEETTTTKPIPTQTTIIETSIGTTTTEETTETTSLKTIETSGYTTTSIAPSTTTELPKSTTPRTTSTPTPTITESRIEATSTKEELTNEFANIMQYMLVVFAVIVVVGGVLLLLRKSR